MYKEQDFILRILSDFIHGENSYVCDIHMDWNEILRYAQIHQISSILYYQLKDISNSDINFKEFLKKIATFYYRDIYLASIRNNSLSEINQTLCDRGIAYFIVKGPEISRFYPIPELRTMGDIDLVIKSDDIDVVRKIFCNMEFSETCDIGNEFIYRKNNLVVEVHDHLIYDKHEFSMYVFFNDCWNHVYLEQNDHKIRLDKNFHFLFLIYHLREHFINSGVGIRQFMDIAVYIDSNSLDWNYITNISKRLGLWNFLSNCICLCCSWFNIPAPIKVKAMEELFYEQSTQHIFSNGVFGKNNEENVGNKIAKEIMRSKLPSKIVLGIDVVKKIFPSYHRLRYLKQYSFLNRRPYLLPLAWIYRLYRCIKHKSYEQGIAYVENAHTETSELEKKLYYFNKWGI